MSERKEELERKRQKLADLRKSREERKSAFQKAVEQTPGADADAHVDVAAPTGSVRENVDELVASLVGSSTATTDKKTELTINQENKPAEKPSIIQEPVLAIERRPVTKLTEIEHFIFEIPPKEIVLYSKEIQTDMEPEVSEVASVSSLANIKHVAVTEDKQIEEEDDEQDTKETLPTQIDLSEEEKKHILDSEDFLEFFDRSTKIVERALHEPFDVLIDYGAILDSDLADKKAVKLVAKFFDDRLSSNRAVTDLQWSPKHPELLLASYNSNNLSSSESNGLVLVWSLHLPERPEYTFQSQASVLTARFSPYNSNLIIGGTYSGQLLVWDMRAKSLPVDKTALSSSVHTHPVYQLEIVGTQNAHNVISVSTDGLVCSWTLDMLAKPQDSLELTHSTHSKSVEVAVTTFGFPENETTGFLIGTEEGNIYQANRIDRAGAKAGLNSFDTYRGHFGPITSLHFHPASGVIDFSDLVITTSTDWTAKLWRVKSSSAKPSTTPTTIAPLHSFDFFTDYVYDARWSPVHPAMFAAVDGEGRLTVWNLNIDTEVPLTTISVVSDGRALNKVRWDNEGKKIAVGSDDGAVFVYDVGELGTPRLDEWTLLQKTLVELVTTRQWEPVGH